MHCRRAACWYAWGLAWPLLGIACAPDWNEQAAQGAEKAEALDAGAVDADADETAPDAQAGESEPVIALLPSDPYLWLRADRGLSVDDRGRLVVWEDQSAHAFSAVAERAESAPTVEQSGELPRVIFDGTQELQLPEVPALGELTFFAVVEVSVEDRRCPSILHLSNSNDGIIQSEDLEFGRHQRELYYESGSKSVPQQSTHSGRFSINVLHVLSVRHDPSTLAVTRIDGNDVHTRMMELPASVSRSRNYLGHNHYFANGSPSCDGFLGAVAEIVLFARALDDDERAHVEQHLSEKWHVRLQTRPPDP